MSFVPPSCASGRARGGCVATRRAARGARSDRVDGSCGALRTGFHGQTPSRLNRERSLGPGPGVSLRSGATADPDARPRGGGVRDKSCARPRPSPRTPATPHAGALYGRPYVPIVAGRGVS
eukprot:6182952-Prymnesium_polylepis.1